MRSLKARTIRTWYRVHKWSSLICTAFLLVSCVTGLPLIFHDEISQMLDHHMTAQAAPAGTPDVNLDVVVATAESRLPAMRPFAISWDEDESRVFVTMSSSFKPKPLEESSLVFDRHTGHILEEVHSTQNFLSIVLDLHRELFAGLFGELLMAVLALLFVIALISGTVVYGPFMRRLKFGTLRMTSALRIYWFDLHNLIGIVTLSWALVVGATGVMNALSTPLFGLWRAQTLPLLLAPYHGKVMSSHLGSVEATVEKARQTLPENVITSLIFPNAVFTSPHHYLVWTHGKTPVTSQLFTPVLIDAETGKLTMAKSLPWYLRALEVSRPLHFGDYGGMPLKIIWALFDVALITVLLSGIYLWLSRRKTPVEDELDRLVKLEELPVEPPSVGVLTR